MTDADRRCLPLPAFSPATVADFWLKGHVAGVPHGHRACMKLLVGLAEGDFVVDGTLILANRIAADEPYC
ncbi:hypothetical protein [Streptomyces cavernae]|uniref:hypothetical protein n=1 Tax=Streptomyces cavernae TaxID=2259034 RepID=UPI000FEBC4CE|nr:hypothetical protein [Streptomyces cavernae]